MLLQVEIRALLRSNHPTVVGGTGLTQASAYVEFKVPRTVKFIMGMRTSN
jgi:hypothetical protein